MPPSEDQNEFEQAGNDKPLSLVQEFAIFVTENKKWWLIPLLLAFGLIGVLVTLGATGAGPFIYTLF